MLWHSCCSYASKITFDWSEWGNCRGINVCTYVGRKVGLCTCRLWNKTWHGIYCSENIGDGNNKQEEITLPGSMSTFVRQFSITAWSNSFTQFKIMANQKMIVGTIQTLIRENRDEKNGILESVVQISWARVAFLRLLLPQFNVNATLRQIKT